MDSNNVKTNYQANQYSSVGNDDFNSMKGNYNTDNTNNSSKNSIFSTLEGYVNTAYEKSKVVATKVKDSDLGQKLIHTGSIAVEKVKEMDLGTKIKNTGNMTVEVLKDTTNKVVTKGTEVAVKYIYLFLAIRYG